jgi:hypothetical protein
MPTDAYFYSAAEYFIVHSTPLLGMLDYRQDETFVAIRPWNSFNPGSAVLLLKALLLYKVCKLQPALSSF